MAGANRDVGRRDTRHERNAPSSRDAGDVKHKEQCKSCSRLTSRQHRIEAILIHLINSFHSHYPIPNKLLIPRPKPITHPSIRTMQPSSIPWYHLKALLNTEFRERTGEKRGGIQTLKGRYDPGSSRAPTDADFVDHEGGIMVGRLAAGGMTEQQTKTAQQS